MSQKLDFIVFGVPRSGTTAATRYLSAAREVHCGIECFSHKVDHSTLHAPECFLENTNLREGSANFRISREDIESKDGNIRYYGNKMPTYYLRLQGVLDEVATPRAILCYRDIEGVAQSYAARAKQPSNKWPAGRLGIFATGDMMIMLKALTVLERADVLVVPYSSVLKDWRATYTTALQFVAPDLEPDFMADRLAEIESHRDHVAKREKPALDKIDKQAINRVSSSGVHELFDRDEPFALSEIHSGIPGILENLPKNPVNWVGKMAAGHSDDAVREFLPTWDKRVRPSWKRLKQTAEA